MHKFFVRDEDINNKIVKIIEDDAWHIYKVLRLKLSDSIVINNSQGKEYLGEIKEINKDSVIVLLKEELDIDNESPVNIHLFQGIPKGDKLDLIVQKAVELGVKSITPLMTERVIVKTDIGNFKKLARLKKIALEACKQSKRSIIPNIDEPIAFEDIICKLVNMDMVIVPYENQRNYGLKELFHNIDKKIIQNVAIIIGPEGGFEAEEIEKLKVVGAEIITLGPRILRTETAGLVCISLLMYEIGDIGGEFNK